MTAETVLDVRALTVGYVRGNGSVNGVVHDVSFRLRRGTILGLVGESGCGKSTAALAALGFRSSGSRITAGQSLFGGVDLLALSPRRLRRLWGSKLAYVAQNAASALNPALTVEHQLRQPLSVHLHLDRRAARVRSLELLEAMGLADPAGALRRYPFQFSGGQQQRIGLAIALACDPDVLILDEPTTGLDVTTQARVTALLRSLVDDLGLGCLYVSHDLALVSSVADSVAVMYAGEFVESGPVGVVVSKRRHPYTRALLAAVPSLQRPRLLVGINGRPPAGVVLDKCAYAPRCQHVMPACSAGRILQRNPGEEHLVRCLRLNEIDRWRVGSDLPAVRAARPAAPRGGAPGAAAGALLEASGIWCAYGAARPAAVKGVGFVVHAGERLAIVGESGSGKSTLLRALAGLHEPTAGSIRLGGHKLAPSAVKRPRQVRRAIQLVFQNPDSSLNPRHTILELVARPIRLFRDDVPRSGVRDAVDELLDQVKLPQGLLHRYPGELSGGQRQRVALARAFGAQPALLLCDEVTSALDVSVQATVLELVAELSEQTQTAVIWVSHDLAVVRAIADRALVLRAGEVCEEGAINDLFSSARHPHTLELLAAVPELPA